MTAALSLASALHGHRPMLVASWQVATAQPDLSSSWVYPAELLRRLLPQASEDDLVEAQLLLPALVGKDQAAELLRDMASDLNGGRACRWSQDEVTVGPCCSTFALEIRSLKVEPKPGLQRHYLLLCAILRDAKTEELGSAMDALMIRNRIDKALRAMTQLATIQDGLNDVRPQGETAERRLPSTLRYHAELFDSEVFCSRAMSMARLPSALVTLTLPQGGVALDEGVYCASMSEDFGAVIAIKSGGTNHSQVAAEMSCFQRSERSGAGSETSMVPVESIGTSGSLYDFRWLRPFYHKLASRQGSVGLQKQVHLDVLAARERLRSRGSEPSKRRRVSLDATRTPSLPPYLVMSEILPYMDLLELPCWAVSSKSFYGAAAQQAMKALIDEALHFPSTR